GRRDGSTHRARDVSDGADYEEMLGGRERGGRDGSGQRRERGGARNQNRELLDGLETSRRTRERGNGGNEGDADGVPVQTNDGAGTTPVRVNEGVAGAAPVQATDGAGTPVRANDGVAGGAPVQATDGAGTTPVRTNDGAGTTTAQANQGDAGGAPVRTDDGAGTTPVRPNEGGGGVNWDNATALARGSEANQTQVLNMANGVRDYGAIRPLLLIRANGTQANSARAAQLLGQFSPTVVKHYVRELARSQAISNAQAQQLLTGR
ncbi:MAG: hypothetical protein K2Z81_04645, partial [Cyanobacteria bacterium]|nr:hypothetical protein [Cyanobacteriota bacterium]